MYDFLRDRGVDGVIVQKLKDEKVQCFDMLYALTFHRLKKADDFGWFFSIVAIGASEDMLNGSVCSS